MSNHLRVTTKGPSRAEIRRAEAELRKIEKKAEKAVAAQLQEHAELSAGLAALKLQLAQRGLSEEDKAPLIQQQAEVARKLAASGAALEKSGLKDEADTVAQLSVEVHKSEIGSDDGVTPNPELVARLDRAVTAFGRAADSAIDKQLDPARDALEKMKAAGADRKLGATDAPRRVPQGKAEVKAGSNLWATASDYFKKTYEKETGKAPTKAQAASFAQAAMSLNEKDLDKDFTVMAGTSLKMPSFELPAETAFPDTKAYPARRLGGTIQG